MSRARWILLLLLGAAALLAGLAATLSSRAPDGLERVAADFGLAAPAAAALTAGMSERLAALVGTAAVLVTTLGLGRLVARRGRSGAER